MQYSLLPTLQVRLKYGFCTARRRKVLAESRAGRVDNTLHMHSFWAIYLRHTVTFRTRLELFFNRVNFSQAKLIQCYALHIPQAGAALAWHICGNIRQSCLCQITGTAQLSGEAGTVASGVVTEKKLMSRLRKLIQKSRSTVGLQLALALLVPAKSRAAQDTKPKPDRQDGSDTTNEAKTAPPHLTGRWDFSRLFEVAAEPELVSNPEYSMARVNEVAHDAVVLASAKEIAKQATGKVDGSFAPKPMSHEEVRLWLQSFNAGPYALLKYKGDVPYKETQNYVPRVLKAYEEDHETEYDEYIEKYALKYGLDPQLIKAIMKTESDFNNETVSHAGARGLMQVMPVVWQDVKKKYGFDWEYSSGVFEPEKNIEVACAYLAWLRYDFLPRHFDAYEVDPEAPQILVRDKDRGVPDRDSPRIVASAAVSDSSLVNEGVVLVAANAPAEALVASDAGSGGKTKELADGSNGRRETSSAKDEEETESGKKSSSEAESEPSKKADSRQSKAEAKPKVEVSDAGDAARKSTTNGKSRVVMRGGNGKDVKISVSNGKVTSKSKGEVAKADNGKSSIARKKSELAKAKAAKEESQGG